MTLEVIINTLAGPFLISFICPIPLSIFLFLIYDYKHSDEPKNPGSQWFFLKSILSRYVSGIVIGVGLKIFFTGNTETEITRISVGAFLGPIVPLESVVHVVNQFFHTKSKSIMATKDKSENVSGDGIDKKSDKNSKG